MTNDDELIVAECDLDWCKQYTGTLFDFATYRRPELYAPLAPPPWHLVSRSHLREPNRLLVRLGV